ncbi:MAG: cytidylyltransferase domain-containing protein [Phycisphaerae bacterium]
MTGMVCLGIILSRAGSKGLPDKCMRELLGRPVIGYTFDHARASRLLTATVLTTDSNPAKDLARAAGIEVIDRPAALATDTATVDAAARHATQAWESANGCTVDILALLYGNIPLRTDGLIDRAIEYLASTGADSVRSVAPVTKQHPDWLHRLEGDRMIQYRCNSIYRRQDLEPLYYHDGAAVAVTREALFAALNTPEDHQAFLGRDRRALLQSQGEAVDIDEPFDMYVAQAILQARSRPKDGIPCSGASC